jgi:hypothetical protein
MKLFTKINQYLTGLWLNTLVWCKKHIILFIAIVAAFLFAYVSFSRTVAFPVEYVQKIPFGILGAAVILWCAFMWVKFGLPESWDRLDDQTEGGVNSISEWERVKVSLFWVSLFSIVAAILAFAL